MRRQSKPGLPQTPNPPIKTMDLDAPSSSSQRRPLPRWAAATAALWAAFQVTACDSPTDPGEIVDPDAVRISEVTGLEAGQTAEVRGQNLDRLGTINLDGVPVTFDPISSTRGQFTTPELRSCETDGRRVELTATSADVQTNARMEVSDLLRLEVGESRILATEELSCLQLGRGMEAYVLSVSNLGLDAGAPEDVLRLNLRGTGEAPPVSATAQMASEAGVAGFGTHDHHAHIGGGLEPAMSPFSPGTGPTEGPFDDYAPAQVGDTLTFVDWDEGLAVRLAGEKEDVPTYEGVVIAIEGDQLVVADLRSDDARAILSSDADRAKLREAAQLITPVAAPAIKMLVGPDFETPGGAGGRMVTMMRDLRPGVAGGAQIQDLATSSHRWSSDLMMGTLSASYVQSVNNPAELARVMAHEFGHAADAWAHRETAGGPTVSGGFHQEAFAVAAEDLMARLSRGVARGAPTHNGPGTFSPQIMRNPMTDSHDWSAWGTPDGSRSRGWYALGGRILRYAQSQMPEGEEWRLHQAGLDRRVSNPNMPRREAWSIQALASDLGMSPEELVEAAQLADLTHGFIDPDVAAAQGLPAIEGWAPESGRSIGDTPWHHDRRHDADVPVELAPGSYLYRHIAGDQARGLSVEAKDLSLEDHHRVRVTRLR